MREIFQNRRFAAETIGAVVLAAALFGLGLATAQAMIRVFADAMGLQALVMTSPTDLPRAGLRFGLALAAPALVSWIAVVVHRARARGAPAWWVIALYVALPALAVAAGIALSLGTAAAMTAGAADAIGGIEPMVAVRDILPGYWTNRVVLVTAPVIWVAAFVLGSRARSR